MKSLFFFLAMMTVSFEAHAENCGDKIQGFNIWEELEEGKIVEKHTTFSIEEISRNSYFEGLVVPKKAGKGAKVEVEVQPKNTKLKARKTSWDLSPWELDNKYLVAETYEGAEAFGEELVEGTFTLRLVKDGKVLCETKDLKIYGGH